MDKLDTYNHSIEQIFLFIKVLDIATKKNLTMPKDKIVYRDFTKNKIIWIYRTREQIELFLDLRIDIIIDLNAKIKKDLLREDSCLSEFEKDKMLRIKKNN